jgi:hypothetical protein
MGTIASSIQFEKHNFFRQLDWRWRLAQRIVTDGARLSSNCADPVIATLARFLRAERRGPDRRQSSPGSPWPAIDRARALAGEGGLKVATVQAYILTGLGDRAIARRCGLDAETVAWYESAFFHVRDRLAARDWLTFRPVGVSAASGYRDLAAVWRGFGAFAGVLALELVIACTTDEPLPARIRSTLKGSSAIEELQIRLVVKVVVALLRAHSPAEVRSIILIRRRARRVYRALTGRRDDPSPMALFQEKFLQLVAQCPRLSKEQSVAPPAEAPSRGRPGSKKTPCARAECVGANISGGEKRQGVQRLRDEFGAGEINRPAHPAIIPGPERPTAPDAEQFETATGCNKLCAGSSPGGNHGAGDPVGSRSDGARLPSKLNFRNHDIKKDSKPSNVSPMAEPSSHVPNPRRVAAGRVNWAKRKGLTPEGREKLREAALANRPWLRTGGPCTPEGKARSAANGRLRQRGPRSVREVRRDLGKLREFVRLMEMAGSIAAGG